MVNGGGAMAAIIIITSKRYSVGLAYPAARGNML